MDERDLADLRRARQLLEHPGFAMRVADSLGRPAGWALKMLPARVHRIVATVTNTALHRALDVALVTLDPRSARRPSDWSHRGAVIASGAVGGAFGLLALSNELPLSPAVMLRSIADHARAQGEDLSQAEARLECLSVFGMGGRGDSDDAAEAGYFASRDVLRRAVSEAAAFIAERGLAEASSARSVPAIARLVARISERFGVTVSEKTAVQAMPIIGGVGGAAINVLFMNHFQDMAWGHFTVRRLERAHGRDAVRAAYDAAR